LSATSPATFLCFLDDAIDGGAVHALGLLSAQLKYFLKSFHVVLGLPQVRLEPLFELRVRGFFNHLGKRLHDLLFGVVDVAQGVHEKVVHILDVLREEAHDFSILVS